MSDSILYTILKSTVYVMRFLPLNFWLFMGRIAGRVYYFLAFKQNRKAYTNLKQAFSGVPRCRLKKILRDMYVCFAQNLIEVMYLKWMDDKAIEKNISIPDKEIIEDAKRKKLGIIFLACHAGSWELSNAATALLFGRGDYAMLAQPQKRHSRLNNYLNDLRSQKGVGVIRVDELKNLINHLSHGKVLGTIADHGGKDGLPVEFFGKLAMTPVGGVRLAKKMDCVVILAFMRRIKASKHEMLLKPYELISTQDSVQDMQANLSNINKVFEGWISQYPQEYLWFYKRWKHSPQKNVLILSDCKAGHLKQSLACVASLKSMGYIVREKIVEAKHKNNFIALFFKIAALLFGARFSNIILPLCVDAKTYENLTDGVFDLVISAGSSLAAINQAVAFENNAKSIAIMKPGILPPSRFSMVIMPKHDNAKALRNIVSVAGSLNTVTDETMKQDFQKLIKKYRELESQDKTNNVKVGFLVGGDSKNYELSTQIIGTVCDGIEKFLKENNGFLFLTTSRRTPKAVEEILKSRFKNNPNVKLFVVASENNPEGCVGGIFYACDILIVSGESVSMVSEAASSGKVVLVFEPEPKGSGGKVKRFLNEMHKDNYINLVLCKEIYDMLVRANSGKALHNRLDTSREVVSGLKRIL